MTAKTNGLDDLALENLESAGLTETDIDDVPSPGVSFLGPPPVVTTTTDLNWPSISATESLFDRALANGYLEAGVEVPHANGWILRGRVRLTRGRKSQRFMTI